jgi:RhtB (resistance to homoserine/threonine) family protein
MPCSPCREAKDGAAPIAIHQGDLRRVVADAKGRYTDSVRHLPMLLSLLAVDLTAAATPGPNFLLVAQAAIHRSARFAGLVVVGLVTANAAWSIAVTLGLSALFRAAPWLYWSMKLVGGAYLVYLGIQAWRSRGDAPAGVEPTAPSSPPAAYVRGLLTGLSNPKSLVYFGSVFTVFLAPGSPTWVRASAVAIVLFDTTIWYGAVAALFSRTAVQHAYARIRRPLDRISAALMVGFGARIALSRD